MSEAVRCEAAVWYGALRIYAAHFASRDFVFDDGMIVIETVLSEADGMPALHDSRLPQPLLQAFELAAPIYRSRFWPRDEAQNRAWIEAVHPTLARLNAPVGSRLAHVYQTPWLRLPYRVDVVNSASWEGSFANAADGYFQIVTSSGDKENSGPVAVDLLYHEASHSVVEPSRGTIGRAISRAAQAADKPEPSELWHALIFYTPSTIIRTLVEQSESRPYRGYPEIAGLSTRVWPRYFAAFARYWQPYVEGRGTLQGALTSVVNSVYQTVVPRTGGLRSSLAQFG